MRKRPPPQPAEIEQTIPVGGAVLSGPSGTDVAVRPTAELTLKAAPEQEYVSGGTWAWSNTYLRSLPFYIDDVTRDFGDDLYERMMQDAQVASELHALKQGILAQGVQIVPAAGEPKPSPDPGTTPEPDPAAEVAAFCERVLSNLRTPLTPVLYDMLDALALGNKVAEMVYRVETEGEDAGKLVLDALKVKPRRAVAFVMDAYNNVAGLLGLIPGMAWPILVQSLIPVTAGDDGARAVPNLLPRRKFAVLTFRQRDNSPAGQSLLRPAYNAWNIKMQLWGEYLGYLSQFASPKVVITTAEGAQTEQALNADGSYQYDGFGNPILISPEQQALTTGLALRNGTVAAFPFGTEVKFIEMAGDGGAFDKGFALLNSEISKAISGQTLASNEGEHQARAAAQVHENVKNGVVQFGKTDVEIFLKRDVLTPLVQMNFPPEAWHLVPTVSLSDTSEDAFAANATAVAALKTANYFTPSQYPAVDAKLALPIRTEQDVSALQSMQDAATQAAQQPRQDAPEGNEQEKP